MATITVKQLHKLRACANQIALFAATFGPEADVSLDNCILAAKVGLDFEWAANNLLLGNCHKSYSAQQQPLRDAYEAQEQLLWDAYKAQEQPLQDAYEAQQQPLWDAYLAQKQSLWNAYAAQIQPLWNAYAAQKQPLWDAYLAQRQPLLDAYLTQCAQVFYTLYAQQRPGQ